MGLAVKSNIKSFLRGVENDTKKAFLTGVSNGLEETLRFLSTEGATNFNPNRTGLRFSKKTGKPYNNTKNTGKRLRIVSGDYLSLVVGRSTKNGVIREVETKNGETVAIWGVNVKDLGHSFDYASYHEGKHPDGKRPAILRPIISPVIDSNSFKIKGFIDKNVRKQMSLAS